MSNKDTLFQASQLITAGDIKQAAELVLKIPATTLTRNENLEFAKIQRRIGFPEQSLRLLAPFVRPKEQKPIVATDDEKAEYALSLQRLGSLGEARQVLATINTSRCPEKLLYEAIFYFHEWNYAAAIPILKQLVSFLEPSEYLYRVAQVNLAAALTSEQNWFEAEPLLDELRRETESRQEYLLFGNVAEISAQLYIQQGNFSRAEEHLVDSQSQLKGVKVLDYLWAVKWKAISKALREKSVEALSEARNEAMRKRHWETLRDLDFYELQIRFEESAFFKLFFGSSSISYKKRVSEAFPQATLPEAISISAGWEISKQRGKDLFFELSGDLAPGTVGHAALVLLLSDRYKEFRPGELHAILFEGEYFNPDTSLNRIHRAIARLRKSVEIQLPGLDIVTNNSLYSLRLTNPGLHLNIPRDLPHPEPLRLRLYMLKSKLSTSDFDVEEVKSILALSKSSANKLIKQWKEQGLVEATSSQKSPNYRVV